MVLISKIYGIEVHSVLDLNEAMFDFYNRFTDDLALILKDFSANDIINKTMAVIMTMYSTLPFIE